jgi:Tol biopolymer transport system component
MSKKIIYFSLILSLVVCASACNTAYKTTASARTAINDTLIMAGEKHFANMRQLTFGGDNAEAYWSYDNKQLVFQKTWEKEGVQCDQIFYGPIPTAKKNTFEPVRLSNGAGRTTCSYFTASGQSIIYASTHDFAEACPPVPDKQKIGKYVWPLYTEFEIYVKSIKQKTTARLTNNLHYDAEGTLSPDGSKMVFTSTRNGDLDLYVMNLDGSGLVQITSELGYDGGAFFSPDGQQLVFRASRPKTEAEVKEYKELLAQNMVAPTSMELFTINTDGSNLKQITQLGKANWAPSWHPSGKKIIFASNHQSERGFPFNLYLINIDGTGLERITNSSQFDAFPMFSPDGKKIAFSSNRNNGGGRDTNIFIADWVE